MENNKFDVKVEIDKSNDKLYLSITHDAYQSTSIRIVNPQYEIPKIIKALADCLYEHTLGNTVKYRGENDGLDKS